MIQLSNPFLTASIHEHGAELCSLKSDGREYLWQADPQYWNRHSPVLFPIVGSVYDKQFRVDGTVYAMGQHGFARDSDFEVVSHCNDEAWFRLRSDGNTRGMFPYDFNLEIGYRLEGKSLRVMWHVENPSDSTILPFQIGAHPAFYWPEHAAGDDRRGFFAFALAHPHGKSPVLKSRKLAGKGCVAPDETFDVPLDDQLMFPLTAGTFDSFDTIILEDSQVNRIALCDVERRPLLALSFSSPLVGLWSPPGKCAPFVCIEPWYGRCDRYGYDGEFAQRDCMNKLEPGKAFAAHYTIEIL